MTLLADGDANGLLPKAMQERRHLLFKVNATVGCALNFSGRP